MQTIDKETSEGFQLVAGRLVPRFSETAKVEARRLKLRLLVIDDENSICELLALYFGVKGLRVTTAGTVTKARTLIEGGEFDLLILDWQLGRADGLDLLNLSKAKHPEVPVLIFTGAEDNQDILKKAFAGRADAVIRKMGSFDALAAEVFARLDRPDQDGEPPG